jgi:putative acetyltransferase
MPAESARELKITIAPETPLQDEVRALIKALNAHLSALSPPEFCFQMTAEQIAETATILFVARDGTSKAVGMGALKRHADGVGEVKRMYTLPHLRGHHIGRAILRRIEDLARSEGFQRLVLETGIERTHGESWRLYQHNGFVRCGRLLDYPDGEWNAFFEKSLSPPA